MKLDRQKYIESRSIKPSYVLLALLVINLVLGVIAYLFPEEGLAISKDLGLKFLSKSDVFSFKEKEVVVVNVDSVLQGIQPLEESSRNFWVNHDLLERIEQELKNSFAYDTLAESYTFPSQRSIQFPDSNPDALMYFLKALLHETDSSVVRVVHYGDSQLEGDRISDYLRNRLQLIFGGSGPGIVLPLEPTAGARRTAYVRQSPNIKKHAIYKKGSDSPHRFYGIGGSSFEIRGFYDKLLGYDTSYQQVWVVADSTAETDSVQMPDTVITPLFEQVDKNTAYVQVSNAKSGYSKVRNYNRIRLLYAADEPFGLSVRLDTTYINTFAPAASSFGMMEWKVPVRSSLRLDFLQGKFPLLYGLVLDGDSGVAVDNFPMRGSSALGFSTANNRVLGAQMKALDVKLIILQYGINVVPYVVSDYTYYKRSLIKEISALKRAHPDVSILVIGPSDMSRNKGGEFQSYSNIPLVRDAMKGAAFETGCAFWDLYEAMGGENSMAAWVESGLANKDFTHFSPKGAKFVGEMLFEALLEQLADEQLINSQDSTSSDIQSLPDSFRIKTFQ